MSRASATAATQGKHPRTLVQKLFDAHRVRDEGGRSLIYIDRLVIADTALPMFKALRDQGLTMRRPGQAVLIPDHFTATFGGADGPDEDRRRAALIGSTQQMAQDLGIKVLGVGDRRRGIQHIVSVEQGISQPGITIVTADSHASTQGAVGALAFSIGSDLVHVLATQSTWLRLPEQMLVTLDGALQAGVTVKDVALALNARIGARGAAGLAVEYGGSFVRSLSVDARMTLCNMSAETGARLGIVAPDETVFDYLRGRPLAPKGAQWQDAVTYWKTLHSDPGAAFDRRVDMDVSQIPPMVTWGNSTENGVAIDGVVPDPMQEPDPGRRGQMQSSLDYMGLTPGMPVSGIGIDQVFIGSCTNARIDDLRDAARILCGRTVKVPTLVVPGSGLIAEQAEAEGLDRIFLAAGARWGETGCSMCSSMNGDLVAEGLRCASTSNRNHIGRQGRGSRTHLVSPPMAAAAALTGHLTDVRSLKEA